jgi:hypothetical protein
MSDDRAGDRDKYIALLDAEIERRRQATLIAMGNPKEQLINKLAEMGRRLRSAPNFVELGLDERRAGLREIKSWLRQRGYLSAGGR